jgi:hypothetical protein
MKTQDGVEIVIGMTIWVNPDCTFEDEIIPGAFTKEQIVSSIHTHEVYAHTKESKHLCCSYAFENIFAKKENWVADRKKRIEEVILAKRVIMVLKQEKAEQYISLLEEIRDKWSKL